MYNNENEIRHEVYRKGRQGKTIKGELREIRHGKEPRLLVTEYNDELIRKKNLCLIHYCVMARIMCIKYNRTIF